MKSLWVAGYPSFVGGADTELDSLIDLWVSRGVDVHLVPMFTPDPVMRRKCDLRGCRTHLYRHNIFKDKIVVSFCNGEFLQRLPAIVSAGKPEAVVWANCMTWVFDAEAIAHQHGWIDYFIFQSTYQRNRLVKELSRYRPVRELTGYRACYNPDPDLFQILPHGDHFAVGRISRDDPAKFAPDTWEIFRRVLTPNGKKVFVLGFGEKVKEKIGVPDNLDYQWWGVGSVPASDVYHRLHALVHKTGGSRENWPRVILESYAHGVVPIVEADYGHPDMVRDGVTGFLCHTSDEMAFRASQLAWDDGLRRKMANAGREFLAELCNPDVCWAPWGRLLDPPDTVEEAEARAAFHRLWKEIHTDPCGSPRLLERVRRDLPCDVCREHFDEYIQKRPPVYGPGFRTWGWRFHNAINRRRGERVITRAAARALWSWQ